MNIYGQDFVSTTGGFNLGDWGQFQVVYTDAGNYGGGVWGGGGGVWGGGGTTYYPNTINWTTIALLVLIAIVVIKVLK